jgi:hypothetical protein
MFTTIQNAINESNKKSKDEIIMDGKYLLENDPKKLKPGVKYYTIDTNGKIEKVGTFKDLFEGGTEHNDLIIFYDGKKLPSDGGENLEYYYKSSGGKKQNQRKSRKQRRNTRRKRNIYKTRKH